LSLHRSPNPLAGYIWGRQARKKQYNKKGRERIEKMGERMRREGWNVTGKGEVGKKGKGRKGS